MDYISHIFMVIRQSSKRLFAGFLCFLAILLLNYREPFLTDALKIASKIGLILCLITLLANAVWEIADFYFRKHKKESAFRNVTDEQYRFLKNCFIGFSKNSFWIRPEDESAIREELAHKKIIKQIPSMQPNNNLIEIKICPVASEYFKKNER